MEKLKAFIDQFASEYTAQKMKENEGGYHDYW
jgi:hypothetical protein